MHDLIGAYHRLDRMYRLYIQSAFPLRSLELSRERDAALRQSGVLSQPPLIETVPIFESSGKTLEGAAQSLPPEYADLAPLGRKLFRPSDELYAHQWRSLREVLVNRKDLVVTTGTGSGKTESFLLPLFAQLARESATWEAAGSPPGNHKWWQDKKNDRVSQWEHAKRPKALRAVILYPLNALVEDQLRRLRIALDGDDVHRWMDDKRGRNRITFGRYTGATPVSGAKTSTNLGRLRDILSEMHKQRDEIMRELSRRPDGDVDAQYHFPRLDGGEMWSRWDVQEAPPDILITNYSMLNIMMMRGIEDNIFEATRQWLQKEDSVFHLIVDELHAYRGTPGTEVAYILRLLLSRLGLSADSPKLRILTTTASLENNESGRRFLREFFGRDNFEIITGQQVAPRGGARLDLRPFEAAFETFARAVQPDIKAGPPDPSKVEAPMNELSSRLGQPEVAGKTPRERLALALSRSGVDASEALRDACQSVAVDSTVRPAQAPNLDAQIFLSAPKNQQAPDGAASTSEAASISSEEEASEEKPVVSDAMRGLMLSLGMSRLPNSGRSPQPTRGHLFFHNLQNLWACSNHECDDASVDRSARADTSLTPTQRPTIGAIHTTHRIACSCGSRVLDLIVCEVCGDVFLGGFKRPPEGKTNAFVLTADQPDLEKMPDRVVMSQRHGQYAVFWPQPHTSDKPRADKWQFTNNAKATFTCGWKKAWFSRATGMLTWGTTPMEPDDVPGWLYTISKEAGQEQSAMPHKCPRCDADYRPRKQYKTPLRNHRTGFQKACQVLAGTLFREMTPDEGAKNSRKLVIFSDSRQDAAKLAAGMERDHFRDMLRLAMIQAFSRYWDGLVSYLRVTLAGNASAMQMLLALNPTLHADVSATAATGEDALSRQRFTEATPPLIVTESLMWAMGISSTNPQAREEWVSLLRDYPGPVPLANLRGTTFQEMLTQGICPGGSAFKAKWYYTNDKERSLWYSCYNWQSGTPQEWPGATEAQSSHIKRLSINLMDEMMYALFPHMARTLEGLGQGWVSYRPPSNVLPEVRDVVDAVIRQLGSRRLHSYSWRFKAGSDDTLRDYTRAYINQSGTGVDDTQVQKQLLDSGAAIPSQEGLVLAPDKLMLRPPPRREKDGRPGYRCPDCNAFYLHPVGICPECTNPRKMRSSKTREARSTPSQAQDAAGQAPQLAESQTQGSFDYYTEMTEGQAVPVFRMNCEELTGQTDGALRPRRQRWFQDIFIGDEIAPVQGVDLLSVTTTMEAGVDIGALNAVMMANMPPRRFNYQQRVGRAGRRASGVSLAITFCRGRSHDDFYYARPESMTGDAPPPPYVDMKSEPIFKRVLIKEVLRQAFVELNEVLEAIREAAQDEEDAPRRNDNVHGEFSSNEEWSQFKDEIEKWLRAARNQASLQSVIEALCVQTRWDGDAAFQAEMLRFLREDLVPRISEITRDPSYTQNALSERLANAGLLPMFGFPTRVRLLYTRWPFSGRNWPPEDGIVDRDLDLAISQFAPRSETVKDKAVHTATGVVDFEPAGKHVRIKPGFYPALPMPNPMGLGLCDNCQAVVRLGAPAPLLSGQEPEMQTCPVCQAEEPSLRVLDAREPKGFFTDLRPEDFEGQFEYQPRSTRPTLSVQTVQDAPLAKVDNALVSTFDDSVSILSLNDNGGQGGFAFQDARVDGQLKTGAYAVEPDDQSRVTTSGLSYRVALLSRRRTDVLLARVEQWPQGVFADPTTVEGRAAWYSFAFWLRIAAGAHLDVDPLELDAGLTVSAQGGQGSAVGQAFLCDKLENGAGYCRFLSQPDEWRRLMQQCDPTAAGDIAAKWLDGVGDSTAPSSTSGGSSTEQALHARECDTSCNKCLRDFGNLPYHGLLDWRLALDMARLIVSPSALVDLTTDWGALTNPWRPLLVGDRASVPATLQRLGYKAPEAFGTLRGFVHNTAKRRNILIERHPLWQEDHPLWQAARDEAATRYSSYEVKATNPFRVLRRPADYS